MWSVRRLRWPRCRASFCFRPIAVPCASSLPSPRWPPTYHRTSSTHRTTTTRSREKGAGMEPRMEHHLGKKSERNDLSSYIMATT
uniref:Uncharacterized protein n=1 Tax=Anopheles braziliensis TaxID=58242 RepID=A0A2M3ZLL7_9DIPT